MQAVAQFARCTESIVSVVIATQNRYGRLRKCLESFLECDVPAEWTVEIIVVENGRNGDARALVNSFSSRKHIHFLYLREPRQGKTFAVNRGVTAASGTILAFTDDDVIVDKRWLTAVLEEFRRDPGLGLVAGRVEALKRDGASVAVTRVFERTVLDGSFPLEGFVLGCNLAIRLAVLEKVKLRDTRLGPGRGLSCEDIDFTYRVLRSGCRGIFSPDPVIYHEPGERDRTREYLRGWGAFYFKFLLKGDRVIARQAWWKVHGIWKAVWEDQNTPSWVSLLQLWQMTVGATLMARRMLVSLLTGGLR